MLSELKLLFFRLLLRSSSFVKGRRSLRDILMLLDALLDALLLESRNEEAAELSGIKWKLPTAGLEAADGM